MAYDEGLANRIREAVAGEPGVTENRMFGGLAFLVHGNMAVAASSQGGLLLRIDPADAESLTERHGVRRFEMRGREMDGWLSIDSGAPTGEEGLRGWVETGPGYGRSVPGEEVP